MIYYELIMGYELASKHKSEIKNIYDKIEYQIQLFNGKHYSVDGENSEIIYLIEDSRIYAAITRGANNFDIEDRIKNLVDFIKSMEYIESAKVEEVKEVTANEIKEDFEEATSSGIIPYNISRRVAKKGWDYLNSFIYNVEEIVVDKLELTYDGAQNILDGLMADDSLREETSRIYDSENSEKFFGYPVHYRIKTKNREAAMDIVKYMVRALHSKNRIQGTRVTFISELEIARSNEDFERLIKNSAGTAVMIEMQSTLDERQYASDKTRIARITANYVMKYHNDSLFFLCDNSDEDASFGNEMISRLENCMDFVQIKEGIGNADEARAYMQKSIEESKYGIFMDDSAFDYLERKKSYNASDVCDAVDEWKRMCLKEKAYKAYSQCRIHKKKKKVEKKKSAYEELQRMVGLDNVKSVIDDILAFYKLKSERDKFISGIKSVSRHMVFTGNPGCAKTTVARLLADILLEKGYISSGRFVECGRADLVGKYVGWTAKTVQAYFARARGGILFIDEAYSLVDGSNSFGDEAINTIVQEMENHRDDVIVIFAGYPDEMHKFIEKNEGLKSRIAFHVDFDDYTENELWDILKLMAKDSGYRLTGECEDKCLSLFKKAVKAENFGNGRYVRNIFEHAIMKQAGRLAKRNRKYSKDAIIKLLPEDFEETFMSDDSKSVKMAMGFV